MAVGCNGQRMAVSCNGQRMAVGCNGQRMAVGLQRMAVDNEQWMAAGCNEAHTTRATATLKHLEAENCGHV
jgi:hypothetical protein